MTARAWCYFRCLVQACYRETRHLGPAAGDAGAKCVVPATSAYAVAAEKCKVNRALLDGIGLWERVRSARKTDMVLAPYVEATGLRPSALLAMFVMPSWRRPYGGIPWARIAGVMLELADAIDADNADRAEALCRTAKGLRHNTGPLVPTGAEPPGAWQRKKWPELCP